MKSALPFLLYIFLISCCTANARNATIRFNRFVSDTLPKKAIDTAILVTPASDTVIVKGEHIFEKVEREAEFPGGIEGWIRFLQRTLKANIPVKKGAPAGSYMVVVQFIVDKNGYVSHVKALTKYGYGMEEEVVRVLNKSPKWVAAEMSGRKVNAYRKQPVTFIVEEKGRK